MYWNIPQNYAVCRQSSFFIHFIFLWEPVAKLNREIIFLIGPCRVTKAMNGSSVPVIITTMLGQNGLKYRHCISDALCTLIHTVIRLKLLLSNHGTEIQRTSLATSSNRFQVPSSPCRLVVKSAYTLWRSPFQDKVCPWPLWDIIGLPHSTCSARWQQPYNGWVP